MATWFGVDEDEVDPVGWVEEGRVRRRSPRMVQSAWMTVLPPRMMFWEPRMVDLRLTLLPVSVSMYSPLRGLGGIAVGIRDCGLVVEEGRRVDVIGGCWGLWMFRWDCGWFEVKLVGGSCTAVVGLVMFGVVYAAGELVGVKCAGWTLNYPE